MKNPTERTERLENSPGELEAQLCRLAKDNPPAFLELLGDCMESEIPRADSRLVSIQMNKKTEK